MVFEDLDEGTRIFELLRRDQGRKSIAHCRIDEIFGQMIYKDLTKTSRIFELLRGDQGRKSIPEHRVYSFAVALYQKTAEGVEEQICLIKSFGGD